MEHLTALIRLISEGGWRFGLPLAFVGGLTILAHRYDLPEPGAVAPYVGWATIALIAGVSFTVVSIVAGAINSIRSAVSRSISKERHRKEEAEELRANFSSLSLEEVGFLVELLEANTWRLKVHILSNTYRLVDKGILRQLEGGTERMCEVPKLLRDDKDKIIAGYRDAMARRSTNALQTPR